MKREDTLLEQIRALFTDVELERYQMHDYQCTAYQFLKDNPFSALFIEMGLGKTVSTGTLIVDLLNDFELADNEKVLIVGPLKVATQTWPNEFRKWRHLAVHQPCVIHVEDDDPELKAAEKRFRAEGLQMQLFTSEREKYVREKMATFKENLRIKKAHDKSQIHIVSRDWVEWLVLHYGPETWPYKILVIDESSAFKDHNSARFKALQAVVENVDMKRVHLLTATPCAESYEHLYAQLYLIDRGTRLGRNITYYRRKYFTENKYTRKWDLRPDAEAEIIAKISDICLVMKEQDYLPREQPLFVNREVFMTPAQHELYLKMEKDMVVELPDGSVVTADTAAAVSAKLLQMGSGVLYETRLEPGQTEDDDLVKVHKIHRIHEHKIEMLKQIVEEAQGRNILVAYHHRSSKERLQKAFPQGTLMDKDGKCVKKWNKGQIPLLFMHPASGGHGLNLQDGGHIIVFFDIPWSYELYKQFIGRLSRQGQKFRVTVFHIVCHGTLDTRVLKALQSKEDMQEFMLRMLRRMRRKLKQLLASRKDAVKEDWDRVVEILTDYATEDCDDL